MVFFLKVTSTPIVEYGAVSDGFILDLFDSYKPIVELISMVIPVSLEIV